MNRKLTINLLIFALFAISIISLYSQEKTITILHTNDIHGSFLPMTIKAREAGQNDRELGGFLALDHFVSEIRTQQKNVLLLDAGDFMTGNPICDIEVDSARGGAMVQFFNFLKYDGQTLGNHEFDISLVNIHKLIKISDYPVFSANVFTTDGKLFTEKPYHIFQKGNLSIGVIGVIVDDLPDYINAPQKNQVLLKPAATVIDSLAKIIDGETDLVIVLSHCGLDEDRKIAEAVGNEVDAIVGGHSHTRMQQAEKVNNILIVQAGSNLANLGRLDLTVDNDRIKNYIYKLIPLWNENIAPRPELAEKVKFYDEEIRRDYGRVIGELLTPWRRSHNNESNIGDFLADVIREYASANIAGINSGGIRQNLEVGPITKLDIKNILPFANSITIFYVSGKEVMEFVEQNAKSSAHQSNGILQVSGIRYEFKKISDGEVKILKVEIEGKPLELEKSYKFATLDFVANNSEKYLGFKPQNPTDLMMPLSELVMKAVEQRQKISSKIGGRMVKK